MQLATFGFRCFVGNVLAPRTLCLRDLLSHCRWWRWGGHYVPFLESGDRESQCITEGLLGTVMWLIGLLAVLLGLKGNPINRWGFL